MIKVKTALISTFYKEGLGHLAKVLDVQGAELISTGGTLTIFQQKGFANVIKQSCCPIIELRFGEYSNQVAAAGIRSVIQPGGSIRDQDSVDACNRLKIKMVSTGTRHFKH